MRWRPARDAATLGAGEVVPAAGPAGAGARRRRLTVGAVALLTATLTALVTDAVTGVLTNGLRGGWERVAGGESLDLNVSVRQPAGEACGTHWLLPPGTGPGWSSGSRWRWPCTPGSPPGPPAGPGPGGRWPTPG